MPFFATISPSARLSLIVAACQFACTAPAPPASPGGSVTARVEYVGTSACKTCHSGIARSFALTGMGRAMAPMRYPEGTELARFPDTVTIADQSLVYSMYVENGRFYQKQYQTGPGGRERNVDVREIIYVLGSGNHSRSFVTVHDGRLYQMPMCWYPEAEAWDLCPGYEIHNAHFRREINETCLFCHNGHVVRTARYDNSYLEPFPHGIGCERCHGPGSLHVKRWTSPEGTDLSSSASMESDETILNPARLPPRLGIQVCMQCHLGDSSQTERVMLDRARLSAFRPGRPLQEFFAIYRFRENLPGYFGLTSQADRLILSRCYTASGGALQCTTCHDPHREVYTVSREEPDHFDKACLTCHDPDDCPDPAAARDGRCVSCHMRRAEPHDQRHTTFLDHWIRRRPEVGIDAARTDYTLIPLFPDHAAYGDPQQRSLTLGRAYLNKKLGSADSSEMPWELGLSALREAVRLDPTDATGQFSVGKMEWAGHRPARAEPHFRAALASDPTRVEATQELGVSLFHQDRLDEAARVLARAVQLGPRGNDEGSLLNELARVQMQRGHMDEARSLLQEALKADPLSYPINANRGLVEALDGHHDVAVDWYRRALSLSPGEPTVTRYLERSLARLGR
ncbi:MAG: tetratricopeptide repeat protein [Acidobacteriota bacterium]